MADIHPDITATKTRPKRLPLWVFVVALLALFSFIGVIFVALKQAQTGPISLGQRVPTINLTTFDGQNMVTSQMNGKVIVINFWASWCQPCASEAAFLQQAYQHYLPGGQVVFMGIDYVDTEPNAVSYISQYHVTYANGPDMGTRIAQTFHIQGVPETYIIDRQGKLTYKELGPFPSLDSLIHVIDPLLK